jgi:hypothetical protein
VRWTALGAAVAFVFGSHIAGATDGRVPDSKPPTSEVSAGVDITAHSWSVYSGFTSTFGSSILKDGWRYRITGGYGEYRYTSTRWTGSSVIVVPFDGTVTFADILVGYQQTLGTLTIKLFAGAALEDHAITPFDIENRVQGQAWGAKGVIETWLNLGERAFSQLDLGYGTANRSYAGRLRLGYKIWPQLSAGMEAGLAGSDDYGSGRAGAFVRYEAAIGEVSLSAGAAGDRSDMTGAYGTVNVLYRF